MIEYAPLLYDALIQSAFVGVAACLVSESKIASPVRKLLKWDLLYCPICLGFWIAVPFIWVGFLHYFLVVALSNIWMLIILKVYRELDLTADEAEDETPKTGE